MKKVIERIIESPGAPNENDLWLNGTTLKKFQNGEWAVIGGGGGSEPDAVKFVEQSLTGEQKAQARTNIGAGSDVDLSNALGKLAVLEETMGITLDPNLDEKYYEYFTIEATQDGTKVYFRQSSAAADEGADPLKVEASTDNGKTWTEVTAAPAEGGILVAILAELDRGDKALIRGKNETYGYYSSNEGWIEHCNFYADSPCYVYGNIMSLIGGDDFARIRKVKEEYAFNYFFSDHNAELDGSWVLSKEGEELLLPAMTLTNRCYQFMFNNCSSLTVAPALPAITLTSNCYSFMFRDCTSLTTVPELPATTLASSCYNYMFAGCSSLTSAPALPATTLADNCYDGMFRDCTGLTSAPELPAIILANSCYSGMFNGCTRLTVAPELPAITLVNNCYDGMFRNCTNLSYIKAMYTTTPGSSYTNNWVKSINGTGTFIKNSAATWNVTGNNGVPTGWTVETADA